ELQAAIARLSGNREGGDRKRERREEGSIALKDVDSNNDGKATLLERGLELGERRLPVVVGRRFQQRREGDAPRAPGRAREGPRRRRAQGRGKEEARLDTHSRPQSPRNGLCGHIPS